MDEPSVTPLFLAAAKLTSDLPTLRQPGRGAEADRAWCAARRLAGWPRLPVAMQVSGLVGHAMSRIALACAEARPDVLAAAREDCEAAIIVAPEQYAPRAMLGAWIEDPAILWGRCVEILAHHPLYPTNTPNTWSRRLDQR